MDEKKRYRIELITRWLTFTQNAFLLAVIGTVGAIKAGEKIWNIVGMIVCVLLFITIFSQKSA